MEFEYDPAKSAKNLAKHGIDFEAAQRMWDGYADRSESRKRRCALHRARHDRRQALDGDHDQARQAHPHHIRAPITQERGGIL